MLIMLMISVMFKNSAGDTHLQIHVNILFILNNTDTSLKLCGIYGKLLLGGVFLRILSWILDRLVKNNKIPHL